MSQALFEYPQKAALYRIIPKNKIYENIHSTHVLRQKFVAQVDKIIWKYKLAPETINLPERDGVLEIHIFTIYLKISDFDENILRCIDEAIPLPIIFELVFENKVKVIAAYKRSSTVNVHKKIVSDYCETSWQSLNLERSSLPIALDLAGLYDQMFRQLIPLSARVGETLNELIERFSLINSKQKECNKLEVLMGRERQFNRKVELNTKLRNLQNELKLLSS